MKPKNNSKTEVLFANQPVDFVYAAPSFYSLKVVRNKKIENFNSW